MNPISGVPGVRQPSCLYNNNNNPIVTMATFYPGQTTLTTTLCNNNVAASMCETTPIANAQNMYVNYKEGDFLQSFNANPGMVKRKPEILKNLHNLVTMATDPPAQTFNVNMDNAINSLNYQQIFANPNANNNQINVNIDELIGQLIDRKRSGLPSQPSALPDSTYHMTSVLHNLLESENRYRPLPHYFAAVQTEIEPYMRKTLVTWMFEVCEELKRRKDVFQLAVNFLDRFLSTINTPKCNLQLLGTACMLLASKFKEALPISSDVLVVYTDHSITLTDLLKWEILLANILDWDIAAPTPMTLLELFIQQHCLFTNIVAKTQLNNNNSIAFDSLNILLEQFTQQLSTLAQYLIDKCLLEYEYAMLTTSMLTATCLCLAFIITLMCGDQLIQILSLFLFENCQGRLAHNRFQLQSFEKQCCVCDTIFLYNNNLSMGSTTTQQTTNFILMQHFIRHICHLVGLNLNAMLTNLVSVSSHIVTIPELSHKTGPNLPCFIQNIASVLLNIEIQRNNEKQCYNNGINSSINSVTPNQSDTITTNNINYNVYQNNGKTFSVPLTPESPEGPPPFLTNPGGAAINYPIDSQNNVLSSNNFDMALVAISQRAADDINLNVANGYFLLDQNGHDYCRLPVSSYDIRYQTLIQANTSTISTTMYNAENAQLIPANPNQIQEKRCTPDQLHANEPMVCQIQNEIPEPKEFNSNGSVILTTTTNSIYPTPPSFNKY